MKKTEKTHFCLTYVRMSEKNGPPAVADRRQRATKDIQGLANDRPDNI